MLSPEARHWYLKMGLFPQFSVLQSQKLPNVRFGWLFAKSVFIFVCSMQPQFQSVCVLNHLKTLGCISVVAVLG